MNYNGIVNRDWEEISIKMPKIIVVSNKMIRSNETKKFVRHQIDLDLDSFQ